MMIRCRLRSLFLFLATSITTSLASTEPPILVSESSHIKPGGTTTVAIQIHQPEGWHSYYLNSGGISQSPSIHWTLPHGFVASPIAWPTPEAKNTELGYHFIYSKSPILLIDITAPKTLPVGQISTLSALLKWQICSDGCRDEKAHLTLNLTCADAPVPSTPYQVFFKNARKQLPQRLDSVGISLSMMGEDYLLKIPKSSTSSETPTEFIPDVPFIRCLSDQGRLSFDATHWHLHLKRIHEDVLGNPVPVGSAVSGILVNSHASFSVPSTETSLPQSTPYQLFLIFGGMALGGLILNLMPCVFPVIGLKIMGFVSQADASPRKIAIHGLVFTLGVFVSFAVLSAILFSARESFGWGYQLQNPWVILAILTLMFLMGLSLFGVFEIGTSATSVGGKLQTQDGYLGTFFSGVLATIVATPCSAPLLGAAIGAAIELPAWPFFTAFGCMALGLALPYLCLSLMPKWIHFLPRPGAWMESFKQGMSFLLFAASAYLFSTYAVMIGMDHLLSTLFGFCLLAMATWIHGRWNLPYQSKLTRVIAVFLILVLSSAAFYLTKPPEDSQNHSMTSQTSLDWQPWSPAAEQAALSDGKTVFIDYTAQWCATCIFNKKVAYTPEVVKLFQDKHVVLLKADKTKPNAEIEKALRQLGRTAIPVNVLIEPGKKPFLFPELLRPNDLINALQTLP